MKKLRSDSILGALPASQLAALHDWLLEQNLGLAETQKRLLSQFGVQISPDSLSRYARRLRSQLEYEAYRDQLNDFQAHFQDSPEVPAELFAKLIQAQSLALATNTDAGLDPFDRMRALCSAQLAAIRQERTQIMRERLELQRANAERHSQVDRPTMTPEQMAEMLKDLPFSADDTGYDEYSDPPNANPNNTPTPPNS